MEFKNCALGRRSVRKFEQKPVEKQVIEEVISVAAYAPSWKNSQTTRYIVLNDKELIDALAENCTLGFDHNKGILKQSPCAVIVATTDGRSGYEKDASATTSKGSHWQSFDSGIATQTFCLSAHDNGLGTVILGIYDEKATKELLKMPEGQSVSAIVAVGYPVDAPAAPPRKSVEDLITYL